MWGSYRVHRTENLLEFIAPTRIIDQPIDSEVNFFLCFCFRRILLYQFINELCFPSFQHLGHTIEYLAAVEGSTTTPATNSTTGSDDCITKILSRAQAYIRQLF